MYGNRAQTRNYALSSAFQQPPSSARFPGGCFSAPLFVCRSCGEPYDLTPDQWQPGLPCLFCHGEIVDAEDCHE